jgi:hypothetical protein
MFLCFLTPNNFLSYLLFQSLSVPDEGYYSNVPDEGYYSNVPDEGYYSNVPTFLE